jgi:hypothetical protein
VLDYFLDAGDMLRFAFDGNKEKFLHTISFFIQNENEEETK